jgi:hypothetical protein
MCLEASSSLSLELRRIAALQSIEAADAASTKRDQVAAEEAARSSKPDGGFVTDHKGGLKSSTTAPALPPSQTGELENASTAVGIRLKMEHCPGSYREDRFKADVCRMLAHRANFVEVIPRTSHTVQVSLRPLVRTLAYVCCVLQRLSANDVCTTTCMV